MLEHLTVVNGAILLPVALWVSVLVLAAIKHSPDWENR